MSTDPANLDNLRLVNYEIFDEKLLNVMYFALMQIQNCQIVRFYWLAVLLIGTSWK